MNEEYIGGGVYMIIEGIRITFFTKSKNNENVLMYSINSSLFFRPAYVG